MADDLVHPDDRPDPAAWCRADLAGSLRGLPGPELADLLNGLPDPVPVDLSAALADGGPACAGLPDTWPSIRRPSSCGAGCCARWSPTGASPAPPAEPTGDGPVVVGCGQEVAAGARNRRRPIVAGSYRNGMASSARTSLLGPHRGSYGSEGRWASAGDRLST